MTNYELYSTDTLLESLSIDPDLWQGSFLSKESSLHQLSPYVGKLKSSMVRILLIKFSKLGDWILDPFAGSGVVPLEALLSGRKTVSNDLSIYAYVLTLGKLTAPRSLEEAFERTNQFIEYIKINKHNVNLDTVPNWVSQFFHKETLKEIVAAFNYYNFCKDYFVCSCLLGILHHFRPGFLSYPASHLTPYLRTSKYPPAQYPEMYEYRDLASRLLTKVKRMMRNTMIEKPWDKNDYMVLFENTMNLSLDDESIDMILSSPPYYGALDYGRDNRLRLWFLGERDWKSLDKTLTASHSVYIPQMKKCLKEMYRVLKSGSFSVLILGDVTRNDKTHNTAETIGGIAEKVTMGGFKIIKLISDYIPDERRSRRRTSIVLLIMLHI